LVYRIELSAQAKHALKWLIKREPALSRRVANALDDLIRDPHQGKPLKGELRGRFSYRIGNYRIIYQIVRHQLLIIVIDIGHRRDIYR